MSRKGRVARTTKESDVLVEIDLDGTGEVTVDTGVPFYDHMLSQLGKHGAFDLKVKTKGDISVDEHHTIEDTALETEIAPMIGSYDTTLTKHIWESFVNSADITLHIKVLEGRNAHHVVEAQFKAVARALRDAVAFDAKSVGIPSTKGVL